MRTVDDWKILLRTVIRDAMRTREPHILSVARETLAAIDNAEARDGSLAPAGQSEVIAGAVEGIGAGEIARRVLRPDEVRGLVERELRERRDAAASYAALGRDQQADTLRRQGDVLETLLRADGDGPA